MIKVFKTTDHPAANGRNPQSGEVRYVFTFPLENRDDYLEVHTGQKGRDALLRMLKQDEEDDARKGVSQTGGES